MPLIPTARSVFPLARRWGAVYASTGWASTTRLPPGRRTSYPHAESDEEEFIYVLEGYPEVWINGYLWKLEPGDSVGFPAGTGVCHTFLNNTEQEVRLLVVGEANKSTTEFTTRSIPAMPRRAGIAGLIIRRSSLAHMTANRG